MSCDIRAEVGALGRMTLFLDGLSAQGLYGANRYWQPRLWL